MRLKDKKTLDSKLIYLFIVTFKPSLSFGYFVCWSILSYFDDFSLCRSYWAQVQVNHIYDFFLKYDIIRLRVKGEGACLSTYLLVQPMTPVISYQSPAQRTVVRPQHILPTQECTRREQPVAPFRLNFC